MPLKLIAPRTGKTPYWAVRGTYLGVRLDRSTKSRERTQAAKLLKVWKDDIERGRIARHGEPTFFDAAVNYMAQTGKERFVRRVLEHFGKRSLRDIDQQVIDQAAIALYPRATPATRNRQVHTVVSAILKHAGIDTKLRRPKGWRGNAKKDWLTPNQAFRVFAAADKVDVEFGLFVRTLCYTGLRLGEALALRTSDVVLSEASASARNSKNDSMMAVYLPTVLVVALGNHPRGMERRGEKLFRFTKCGRLYTLLGRTKASAGADIEFQGFHVLRHTWATWMRRYAGLDTEGLLATGRWKDAMSARRYQHLVVSEESRKAELLPVENPWKGIEIVPNPLEKKNA
jgi:integrase